MSECDFSNHVLYFLTSRRFKVGPKMVPGGPKWFQGVQKMVPRGPKNGSKGSEKWFQGVQKMVPRGPKNGPTEKLGHLE